MVGTTVRRLTRFGGWVKEIPRESGRYLTRWSLREQKLSGGGGWRCYLHRFWAGDLEEHDHPWHWSFSIILWGSYTETYWDHDQSWYDVFGAGRSPVRKTRRVRWFNWIPRTRFHQITELHPGPGGAVWTLFFSGPLHGQSWGFWVEGRGRVGHDQRKQERGIDT